MARDFWVIFKHKARGTKTHKLVDGRCWHFCLSGRPSVQISRLASATQPQDVNTKCCVVGIYAQILVWCFSKRLDAKTTRLSVPCPSQLFRGFMCFSVKFRFGFFVCANLDTTNNFFLLAIWYQILSCGWFQFAFVYFLANFLGFNRLDRNVVVFLLLCLLVILYNIRLLAGLFIA